MSFCSSRKILAKILRELQKANQLRNGYTDPRMTLNHNSLPGRLCVCLGLVRDLNNTMPSPKRITCINTTSEW